MTRNGKQIPINEIVSNLKSIIHENIVENVCDDDENNGMNTVEPVILNNEEYTQLAGTFKEKLDKLCRKTEKSDQLSRKRMSQVPMFVPIKVRKTYDQTKVIPSISNETDLIGKKVSHKFYDDDVNEERY